MITVLLQDKTCATNINVVQVSIEEEERAPIINIFVRQKLHAVLHFLSIYTSVWERFSWWILSASTTFLDWHLPILSPNPPLIDKFLTGITLIIIIIV